MHTVRVETIAKVKLLLLLLKSERKEQIHTEK